MLFISQVAACRRVNNPYFYYCTVHRQDAYCTVGCIPPLSPPGYIQLPQDKRTTLYLFVREEKRRSSAERGGKGYLKLKKEKKYKSKNGVYNSFFV